MTTQTHIDLAELLDEAERDIRNARAELKQASTSSSMYEVLMHLQNAHSEVAEAVSRADALYESWSGQH